jgi:hypothetical protein
MREQARKVEGFSRERLVVSNNPCPETPSHPATARYTFGEKATISTSSCPSESRSIKRLNERKNDRDHD